MCVISDEIGLQLALFDAILYSMISNEYNVSYNLLTGNELVDYAVLNWFLI